VTVSDALAEALRQNGIPVACTIHNGIDASLWVHKSDEVKSFKDKHNVGDYVVLFGGRLSRVKGAPELLRALAEVAKKLPQAQLVVIGTEDAYTTHMRAFADELGVGKQLVFTGWITGEERCAAYHSAALVCVPSVCFDSFPTMNLEAMACCKPVIATCLGGSREQVVDGETGYVVNPFDIQTMAGRMVELLVDKEKNARFGKAGYERVVSVFSPAKQIQKYERLFTSTHVRPQGDTL